MQTGLSCQRASVAQPLPQLLGDPQCRASHHGDVAADQYDSDRYHPKPQHGKETEYASENEENPNRYSDPNGLAPNQLQIPANRVSMNSGRMIARAVFVHQAGPVRARSRSPLVWAPLGTVDGWLSDQFGAGRLDA